MKVFTFERCGGALISLPAERISFIEQYSEKGNPSVSTDAKSFLQTTDGRDAWWSPEDYNDIVERWMKALM